MLEQDRRPALDLGVSERSGELLELCLSELARGHERRSWQRGRGPDERDGAGDPEKLHFSYQRCAEPTGAKAQRPGDVRRDPLPDENRLCVAVIAA